MWGESLNYPPGQGLCYHHRVLVPTYHSGWDMAGPQWELGRKEGRCELAKLFTCSGRVGISDPVSSCSEVVFLQEGRGSVYLVWQSWCLGQCLAHPGAESAG